MANPGPGGRPKKKLPLPLNRLLHLAYTDRKLRSPSHAFTFAALTMKGGVTSMKTRIMCQSADSVRSGHLALIAPRCSWQVPPLDPGGT